MILDTGPASPLFVFSSSIMAADSTITTLSEDFYKRARVKLDAATAGKFFQSNDAKLLPSFDRCGAAAAGTDEDTGGGDGKCESLALEYNCNLKSDTKVSYP